ncbi:MAG: CoA-binding protein, partial [Candidatus Falkowbacteria bacterium]|nr:CoA-binding protein [Candidatus Falkowbacteria bacterium]
MDKKINYLFNPKTIAVIGASNEKGSVGYNLFANLINSKYQGKVYPVNIKRKKIQNVIAYLTIKDVPTKIDLAVIAVPAKFVPAVVEECGQAGVKTAVIISAGFKEIGPAGEKLQQTLVENAHKYGIQILGPNCLGFIRTDANLNVSFAGKRILPGKTAFLSQSGALGTALLDWLGQNNIGYSYFISLGGMADLDFTDLIEYLCSDKNTDNILIYMESLPRGRKFLEIAAKITASKPIMIIKTGRSVAGARAAKSHTGSLTGDDQVFSAAFEQAGIIRIDTIEDFFNVSKSIAMQPQPTGNRLAIVTNAGGVGVIATDALMFYKGELANLNKASMAELNKILPTSWSHGNPVDILGDADSKRYSQAIKICL